MGQSSRKLTYTPDNKEIAYIVLKDGEIPGDTDEEREAKEGKSTPQRPKLIIRNNLTGKDYAPSTPNENLIMGLLQAPTM